MAALQDSAEFQIVPSDSRLSGTHSRPCYDRNPSSTSASYAVSSDPPTAHHIRSKTQVQVPLPVKEEGRKGIVSSSGAMSAYQPTQGDVSTSSAGDKHELGLSSARMKRRESRKSKTHGPAKEVNPKPPLGVSVREGELATHSAQEVGDVAVVGASGGGEVVCEDVWSEEFRGRKKLQKKKAVSSEKSEPLQQDEDIDGAQSYQQCVGEDTTADHPLEHTEKLIQSMTPPHSSSPLPHPSSTPSLRSTTPPPDDESVLSVTIHHCTALQPHSLLRHPLVKVHFVNANTGEYLLKTDRRRRVVSYYETERQGVDYILPTATQPCILKASRKPYSPVWEESLVINEAISSIVMPSTVVFFEVLDFVDFSSVPGWSSHANPASQDYCGWFKVAWAFLQLVGTGGNSNVGRMCRLQLYHYPSDKQLNKRGVTGKTSAEGKSEAQSTVELSRCKVFQIWAFHERKRYPSSLTVSLRPFKTEDLSGKGEVEGEKEGTLRSMLPMQPEGGRVTFEDLLRHSNAISMPVLQSDGLAASLTNHGRLLLPPWSRLPGQSCVVPDKACVKLPAGDMGGTALAFSRSGRLLVVALVGGGLSYPIAILSIPDGKLQLTLKGHGGIVHDLSWSHDDHVIISASSDCTAKCWVLGATPSQLYLPHPSYVYAAQFHPTIPWLAVTGGYDGVVRGWGIHTEETPSAVKPLFEVLTLAGHINAITFGCLEEGSCLFFTGHSSGKIGEWEVRVDAGKTVHATCKEERDVQGITGKTISHLAMHPLGNRILVHTRGDSTIHLLDLRVSIVQHRYIGAVNLRSRLRGCLCSCGAHVLAGSEDGAIHVWNTDTGEAEQVLRNLPSRAPASCIAFHPHDHMFATVSYGAHEQVLLFKHA